MIDQPTRPASTPVWRVSGDVRLLALALAGGDRRLLEVTGPDQVLVHNQRRP
jgi:hypothetical protein